MHTAVTIFHMATTFSHTQVFGITPAVIFFWARHWWPSPFGGRMGYLPDNALP